MFRRAVQKTVPYGGEESANMTVIAVAATLDTKGAEAEFLKRTIERMGASALLIDTGMGNPPTVQADIPREAVFAQVGIGNWSAFLAEHGKAAAQDKMREGLGKLLYELQKNDRVQGVLSVGGAQGTAISTAAMQSLPIGFPKVMVSTVACGSAQFGDYVGNRDIVMIPSIADICGLNSITIPIFTSGCGAVVGMANARKLVTLERNKPVIAMTMSGVTTPCVMGVKEQLDAEGYETILCHTNVTGTKVVDELAQQGKIQAVLDITTHEWGGYLFDGLMKCDEDRFAYIYNSSIPIISLPGCIDVMLKGPYKNLPPELQCRAHYAHTPFHTHLRTTRAEMYAAGRLIAEKHNLCQGKNAIIIPRGGYSMQNRIGHVLYDPEANAGFEAGVRDTIADTVECITTPAHINDSACIDLIVNVLNRYMEGVSR